MEETERGLKIYVTDDPSGNPYVVATNMKDGRRIVSSMYRNDNNPFKLQSVTDGCRAEIVCDLYYKL